MSRLRVLEEEKKTLRKLIEKMDEEEANQAEHSLGIITVTNGAEHSSMNNPTENTLSTLTNHSASSMAERSLLLENDLDDVLKDFDPMGPGVSGLKNNIEAIKDTVGVRKIDSNSSTNINIDVLGNVLNSGSKSTDCNDGDSSATTVDNVTNNMVVKKDGITHGSQGRKSSDNEVTDTFKLISQIRDARRNSGVIGEGGRIALSEGNAGTATDAALLSYVMSDATSRLFFSFFFFPSFSFLFFFFFYCLV